MSDKKQAKRILIVEDSRDMQDIYRTFFKEHSGEYKIDIEGDAKTALESIKKDPPDLIVLDIIMEPMTGEAFLVYARENEATAHIPIIVVSVLNPEMLSGLKRFNHMDFLQKPITEPQLMEAVKKQFE